MEHDLGRSSSDDGGSTKGPAEVRTYSLNGYQELARQTAVHPERTRDEALTYLVMGLAGEAGEVANRMKKYLRGDLDSGTHEWREKMLDEMGDVLWYLARIADVLGESLETVAAMNLTKLARRQAQGTLKGDGGQRGVGREA